MDVYCDNTDATSSNGIALTYYETCPNVPDELDMPMEEFPSPKQTFERMPVKPRFMQRPVNVRARTKRLRQARGLM